jgi:protein-disulfide isomerase
MPERITSVDEPLWTLGEPLATPIDGEDHVDGPAGARVTVVLYGDYECPFTRGTHDVVRNLLRRGEVAFRYVFRHFPLPTLHPHAVNAARAAEAAASVGRFWPMHDALFAHQDALDDDALTVHAAAAGVSAAAVRAALDDGVHDRRIARDVESGIASGVRGTPALFVHGRRYTGPRRSRELGAAVRAAMPGAG